MTWLVTRAALYGGWIAISWGMSVAVAMGGLTMILGVILLVRYEVSARFKDYGAPDA